MRIRVISLPTADRRRAQVERQLGEIGIDFEFFDALCPERVSREQPFQGCDERLWILNTGREMTAAEVACFASHRALWQECAASGEPLMIMEDDFRLINDFERALHRVEEVIEEYGFIRLQTETRAASRPVRQIGRFRLCKYLKAPHSTMCYAVSPAAAERLLSHSTSANAPVDVFIKQFWLHGQTLHGLLPYTVTESDLSRETQIASRSKSRKALSLKLARSRHRLAEWLRRMRYNHGLHRT